MRAGASKVLVVDASVARAAGLSDRPDSSASRAFLRGVLDICHRIALTPALSEEWRKHQSRYTREWRRSMYARKKVQGIDAAPDNVLRNRLRDTASGEHLRGIRDKDMLLIEAALRTDRIVVVSLDEEAREAFQVRELSVITWVNPVRDQARISEWLEGGADPVEAWKLGAQG